MEPTYSTLQGRDLVYLVSYKHYMYSISAVGEPWCSSLGLGSLRAETTAIFMTLRWGCPLWTKCISPVEGRQGVTVCPSVALSSSFAPGLALTQLIEQHDCLMGRVRVQWDLGSEKPGRGKNICLLQPKCLNKPFQFKRSNSPMSAFPASCKTF